MPPSFDGYSLQFTLDSWAPPFDEEWGMNVHSGATISFSCLGPQLYVQFVYKATLSFTHKAGPCPFILILSGFYPDKIRIKSGQNLDKVSF